MGNSELEDINDGECSVVEAWWWDFVFLGFKGGSRALLYPTARRMDRSCLFVCKMLPVEAAVKVDGSLNRIESGLGPRAGDRDPDALFGWRNHDRGCRGHMTSWLWKLPGLPRESTLHGNLEG